MPNWEILLLGLLAGGLASLLLLYAAFRLGLWYLKRRLGAFVNQLASSIQAVPVPSRITLRSQGALADWHDAGQAGRSVSDLKALGFEEVDSYHLDQLPGVHLQALVHPQEHLWGVVTEHPQAGLWIDLVSCYADGQTFTVASAPETGLDQPPRHPNLKLPGASAEALRERMLSERPPQPVPLHPETFVEHFQGVYAQVMDWRLARVGPTASEVQNVAALQGHMLNDQELGSALRQQRQQYLAELHALLHSLFLEQSDLSAARWEKVRDRVVFVHDELSEDELRQVVGRDLPPGGSPRQRAEGFLQSLGVVKGPVEADALVLSQDP